MDSSERIEFSIDSGTWNPMDEDMISNDPIKFHSAEESYKNRIDFYQIRTGLTEAVQTGTGQLNGIPVAIGIMDFNFMGGSMGSVVVLACWGISLLPNQRLILHLLVKE
ncbi:hypothetical protein VNO80_32650 [Phaseolus coccineus]|uniref:CoA carboxyltransferase N-terminal domain-containing protein n=1 Tax=Phaseolus coccineus TaxID=3886 RepID=A0AAN9L404_PHACN